VNLTLATLPLSYQNVIKPLSKAKEETAAIKFSDISNGSSIIPVFVSGIDLNSSDEN
jgi:hypothetical protein